MVQAPPPTRIVQFGEGVFLRGFVDAMIHRLNQEAGAALAVTLVQPRDSDSVARLMAQDGRYTLVEQGLVEGAESSTTTVIDCIDRGINTHRDPEAFMRLAADPAVRVIVSNTTEAGISFSEADAALDGPGAAAASYPGKLAWWLHARFLALPEAAPLYVLPCELIAANGTTLRSLVVRLATGWGLGDGFLAWLDSHVVFYDTLVDRIVPGKSRDDVAPLPDGSVDSFPVQAEVFHSWYLQGPRDVLDVLPLHALDLNVTFVADLTPYRDLKVRVLNGTHSTLAPVALLAGVETVSEAVDHAVLGPWLRRLVEREIVATLALPREETDAFVAAMWDRFRNPFIRHEVRSILLNGSAKFPARIGQVVVERHAVGERSPMLALGVASWLVLGSGQLPDSDAVRSALAGLWSRFEAGSLTAGRLAVEAMVDATIWGEGASWPEPFVADVAAAVESLLVDGPLPLLGA